MAERYPGYDVLAKRHTSSWNEQTRRVIDQRIGISREPRFFTEDEFATLSAIADRITPQPNDRPPIPVAALIDDKLVRDRQDGYRGTDMPRQREAWQRGLNALDAEAQAEHGAVFRELDAAKQDQMLALMETGELHHRSWCGMPPKTFFKQRLLADIVMAYWSHPVAWNEIGWGGPAGPRGYVRMGYDKRDPWEAVEASPDGSDDNSRQIVVRKNRNVG